MELLPPPHSQLHVLLDIAWGQEKSKQTDYLKEKQEAREKAGKSVWEKQVVQG